MSLQSTLQPRLADIIDEGLAHAASAVRELSVALLVRVLSAAPPDSPYLKAVARRLREQAQAAAYGAVGGVWFTRALTTLQKARLVPLV